MSISFETNTKMTCKITKINKLLKKKVLTVCHKQGKEGRGKKYSITF